jgi:GT2 family glycosyltransferase|tara:strand:+ start:1784 stop:2788 length:1005 start_codon:yes stop_codon:yes gene_type:complete
MNKSISISVITWNDWKNTIVCLESILQNTYQDFDIVLINNGSEKHHIEKIIEWASNKIPINDDNIKFNENKKIKIVDITNNFKITSKATKNIFLINLEKNIGLAPAVNLGFKFSMENNYDLSARIDCDFIITKNCLEKMSSIFLNENNIVAASPKINHASLRNTIWWKGHKPTWSYLKFQRTMNLKKRKIIYDINYSGVIETDAIAGCCSFYRTEILKVSGLEDEDFEFGPEDIELSFRLKKIGKLVVNLDVLTFHKIAMSVYVSGWFYRSYNETKGFLLLIKKTGTLSDKIIGYIYHILRIPYFFTLLILKQRSKDRVIGYTKGCLDFFLGMK